MRITATSAFNAKLFHEDLKAAAEELGSGSVGATALAASAGISYNTLWRVCSKPCPGISAALVYGLCRALNLAPERYLVSSDPAAARAKGRAG